jgi:nucleotide-binding universal stress UspA family protein
MSYARVLAVVNASAAGQHAAREAAVIAAEHGARLRLLHVADSRALGPDAVWLPLGAQERAAEEEARRALAAASERATAAGLDPSRVECVVRDARGGGASVAAAEARDWGCDLVVVGASARPPHRWPAALSTALVAGAFFFGFDPAPALIAAADVPVLVVHAQGAGAGA